MGLAGQERRLARRGDLGRGDAAGVLRQVLLEVQRLVASRPNTSIATNASTPNPASTVTTRWKVRVGSSTTTAMRASTTRQPMNPGVPVIAPVESVNQVFASWKKLPPAPIPMMRAVICRLRSTSGTSKAMISTEAMTSVHDSSQPRNGCTIRVVKT